MFSWGTERDQWHMGYLDQATPIYGTTSDLKLDSNQISQVRLD